MKNIAILTYSLGGAGAERVVANLINHLDREKYNIHLVLMNTEIEYEILPDQKVHFIEKSYRYENELWKFIKLPFLGYRFKNYCNEHDIDLALTVMNRPNFVGCFAKLMGIKAKVLISERFYTPFYYNFDSFAGKIKTSLLKWLYPKADAILPNSLGTIDALKHYYHITSEYFVVKNPADISKIKRLAELPLDQQFRNKKFSFLNVATFREEKNHEILIDAVAALKEIDFELILVGKGELLSRIKQKVVSLDLEEKVRFVNFTENPYQYMKNADCFLLSSLGEGFPNVLIESMLCGLPIISVDCKTGPRELLSPSSHLNTVIGKNEIEIGEYGVLCANNSKNSLSKAMKWAIDNPVMLEKYSRSGLEKANQFEIKNVCDEFSVIFDKFLKNTGA